MDKIQKKAEKLGEALKSAGEKSKQRQFQLGKLEETIQLMENEAKLYEKESKKLLGFITKEAVLYFSFSLMVIGCLLVLLSIF